MTQKLLHGFAGLLDLNEAPACNQTVLLNEKASDNGDPAPMRCSMSWAHTWDTALNKSGVRVRNRRICFPSKEVEIPVARPLQPSQLMLLGGHHLPLKTV